MDFAKLSEKRNKSFTFIPMEDLETHQTTNIFVNDPNGNSPSQLHHDLQDEKFPEVYQFQSQDNRVYSDYITMLPTEDIIAQFHKQPHEIHFGGTDYQHYFNEKYEYSAPYPTEDHARAIKNAKLVTPQNITTLNIMANLYESQTRPFIFTPTTNYDFNKDASHNTSARVSNLKTAFKHRRKRLKTALQETQTWHRQNPINDLHLLQPDSEDNPWNNQYSIYSFSSQNPTLLTYPKRTNTTVTNKHPHKHRHVHSKNKKTKSQLLNLQ